MRHANEVEEEKEHQKIIEQWKEANGIADKNADDDSADSWASVIRKILLKPYPYVVLGVLVISPYGVDIVKMFLETFAK